VQSPEFKTPAQEKEKENLSPKTNAKGKTSAIKCIKNRNLSHEDEHAWRSGS
jgi:hypothetical protein